MIYTGHRRCSHISVPGCNCHRLRSVTWHENVVLYDELSTVRKGFVPWEQYIFYSSCRYQNTYVHEPVAFKFTKRSCKKKKKGRKKEKKKRTRNKRCVNFSSKWLVDWGVNLTLEELHLDRDSLRAPEEVIHKPHITQRLASLSPSSIHFSCSLLWKEIEPNVIEFTLFPKEQERKRGKDDK